MAEQQPTASGICAFCGEPAAPGAWVEIRLYLGLGDKIGVLELRVCRRHLTAMRPAYCCRQRCLNTERQGYVVTIRQRSVVMWANAQMCEAGAARSWRAPAPV
jgi:hypothetical protein